MGTPASLLDLIAHGGSLRSSLDNSQIAADTAHTNAATGLTQAQVPLVNQQTEQEKIKTQLAQRQIRDEEIQRQIWADAGKGMSARGAGLPATDETGSPLPGQGRVGPPAISPAAVPAPGTPLLPGAANAPDFVNYLDNPRAYAAEMARRGASAPAVTEAYKNGVAIQTSLAKLSKDQLDNEIAEHSVIAGSLQGYLNTPDEQKAQAYPQFYADAVARQPNLKGQLPAPAAGFAPSQNDLAHAIGSVGLSGTLLANAKEKQATATSGAEQAKAEFETKRAAALLPTELAKANAEAAHITATLPKDQAEAQIAKLNADFAAVHGGLTPDQFTTTGETKRHNSAQEAVQRGELGIKQKTFDATLGSGLDANGQPLSPEAMKTAALQDPTAVAIAHYQVAPPPATTRGGMPNPVLRKVLAINPQYDATTYPARAATARGYSPTGQQGQQITAADTALAHLNTLSEAGKALQNGDIQAFNRIGNAIGVQLGSNPKAAYDTILNMVGPEISKSVIGAVGGEGERAGTAKNFSSDLSPKQRESNIAAAVGLLSARYDKAAHAYEQQMGVPLPRSLSPESQSVRQKYTAPSTAAPAAATGHVIDIGGKHYQYKGTGDTADIKSYSEVP